MSIEHSTAIEKIQILKYFASIFDKSRCVNNLLPADITRLNLIEKIVINEYNKAYIRINQPSNLFALIEALPLEYSVDTRLNILRRKLTDHVAMPVLTSHPTRVVTNLAISRLYDITSAAIDLGNKNSRKEVAFLKKIIKSNIVSLISEPIVLNINLTPKEEAEYTLFIYKKILESFPSFFDKLVDKFYTVHGGCHDEISDKLKPAIMLSFRNIYSWTRGDADGNYNVTRKTMEQTVPAQQVAIIEIYRDKLEKISKEARLIAINSEFLEKINKIDAYLARCINSIHAGIWFDVAGSNESVKNINNRLSELQINLPEKIKKMLLSLTNLVDLAEFFGGMKEYVRQTTKLNCEVLDNLLSILVNYNVDIRKLAINKEGVLRKYSELSRDEKILFHKIISSNPAYFLSLKQNSQKFSAETVRELERLFFVLQHADIFPFYICSDTEDKINFNEVQILLRFSSYLDGYLRIRQMNNYPINFLFLCENPKDLGNLTNIMSDILSDDYLRKRIVSSGYISYVSGPSDLGKTGGIVTHISLYLAELKAMELLCNYKLKYKELRDVKLRVLNGYGGDMKRRIGSASLQSHSTFQGLDAYDCLGAPGAFSCYVHEVAGISAENQFKVNEILEIRRKNPLAFEKLLSIEKKGVGEFQLFINEESSKNLLVALTNPDVEKKLNTSSRAGSKLSTTDITRVRAIGITNLYLYAGVNFDIFMSVAGWISISKTIGPELAYLFKHSTVVKDIIYKVIFSIAVSNIPRAWQTINKGIVPEDTQIRSLCSDYKKSIGLDKSIQQALAYIDISSYQILKSLLFFLPKSQQKKGINYFKEKNYLKKPSHAVALELMDILGDDFKILAAETRDILVDFTQLADCIDAYEADSSELNLENVILCLRGGRIPGGPDFIAKSASYLRTLMV